MNKVGWSSHLHSHDNQSLAHKNLWVYLHRPNRNKCKQGFSQRMNYRDLIPIASQNMLQNFHSLLNWNRLRPKSKAFLYLWDCTLKTAVDTPSHSRSGGCGWDPFQSLLGFEMRWNHITTPDNIPTALFRTAPESHTMPRIGNSLPLWDPVLIGANWVY